MEPWRLWLQAAYLAAAGAAVGSFLNVCIDRLPAGRPILVSRSICDTCHRVLGPGDLVPLLSYLWLRGRCRSCHAPIPPRLFLVELLTGALFAVVALAFADSLFPQGVVLLLYAGLLIAIFFIDLEHQLVLDKVVYPALPVVLLLAPWGPPGTGAEGWGAYLSALGGGGAAFALFLAIYWAARSRDGMGAGDVKLSLLVGLMLGAPLIVVAVLLGFVTGGGVGVFLLASRRKGLKSPVPSATFLTGGAIVAMAWGNALWKWYLGLFG